MRETPLAVAVAGLLCVCGCETTPSDPPVTPVVDPVVRSAGALSRGAAVTRMITALTTRCAALANAPAPPRTALAVATPSPMGKSLARDAWRGLIRMGMIKAGGTEPDYRLKSELKDGSEGVTIWTLSLTNPDGSSLWSESLVIDSE